MPWHGETKQGANPWYGGGASVEPVEVVVAGASAGDVTVTGINAGDELVSVLFYTGSGTDVTEVVDLTSEFSITADDTINNATGTDTSGGDLKVLWRKSVNEAD